METSHAALLENLDTAEGNQLRSDDGAFAPSKLITKAMTDPLRRQYDDLYSSCEKRVDAIFADPTPCVV